MAHFQVKLGSVWKDFPEEEDRLLKREFEAGPKRVIVNFRGQRYEIDFKAMTQKNTSSGRIREIRPPRRHAPPPEGERPLAPAGRMGSAAGALDLSRRPRVREPRADDALADVAVLPESAVKFVPVSGRPEGAPPAEAADTRTGRVDGTSPSPPPAMPKPMTMQALRGHGATPLVPVTPAPPLASPTLPAGFQPSAPPPSIRGGSAALSKTAPPSKEDEFILDLF